MDNLTFLTIFLTFSLALTLSSVYGEDSVKARRLSATPVNPGEYPYVVTLKHDLFSTPFCVGSIIGSKYILTEGECVYRELVGDFLVMVGCIEWNSPDCQTFQVQEYILHPKYVVAQIVHNIAVVVLTEEISFNEFAQPIPLSAMHMKPNTSMTGVGMDLDEYIMKWETLTSFANPEDCFMEWAPMEENGFCSLPAQFVTMGSFGGPVIIDDQQVGVAIVGFEDGDVILKIESYLDFILGVMKRYDF